MLREAVDGDREMVRRWRNHEAVRRVSFTTHEIPVGEHRLWWEAVRADPARRVLIYERGGRPCGVVNFFDHDPVERSAMWGMYLDLGGLGPTGELLAAWSELEAEAIEYAFGPMGLWVLRAEALVENEPVRWLHRRYGFVETPGGERVVGGVAKRTVLVELTRDTAPAGTAGRTAEGPTE